MLEGVDSLSEASDVLIEGVVVCISFFIFLMLEYVVTVGIYELDVLLDV